MLKLPSVFPDLYEIGFLTMLLEFFDLIESMGSDITDLVFQLKATLKILIERNLLFIL